MLFRFRPQRRVLPLRNDPNKKVSSEYDDGIRRTAYNLESLDKTSHLPRSIYCPISNMPMMDPVIAVDGYSYERQAIQTWFKKNNRSPVTNKKINSSILIPNHNLRNTITELIP